MLSQYTNKPRRDLRVGFSHASRSPAQAGDAEAPEDWKVHARQWERRAKADRKHVESLTDLIKA